MLSQNLSGWEMTCELAKRLIVLGGLIRNFRFDDNLRIRGQPYVSSHRVDNNRGSFCVRLCVWNLSTLQAWKDQGRSILLGNSLSDAPVLRYLEHGRKIC